ncbi:unnamed protein product [Prorocentrum cordatum]|uniref:beta-glucosidase n=1 Tax=Prorocentrum cordatum TaxID=2364126 RepID=A0ABN9R791_9DINO|nr:unnamed protein product [Polarella glacialis]
MLATFSRRQAQRTCSGARVTIVLLVARAACFRQGLPQSAKVWPRSSTPRGRGSAAPSQNPWMAIPRSQPDSVIACGGGISGEDNDRVSLKLNQHEFLMELASRSANETQVPLEVLTTSTGSILTNFREYAAVVLSLFVGRQETGNAFADVLFGVMNPSAKLPVMFPVKESDGVSACGDQTCFLDDGLFLGWHNLIGKDAAFEFLRCFTRASSLESGQSEVVTFGSPRGTLSIR